jgi:iron-regulated transporter 1
MEKKVQELKDAQVYGLLAVLCVLAGVEKVSAMANTIAVERDWVVVMTDDDDDWRRSESCFFFALSAPGLVYIANYGAVINARMRRIDLLCKLLGPLAISFVATASTLVAIWTVLGMNTLSVLIEYICIARVCSYRAFCIH